jgi:hypothetical protein
MMIQVRSRAATGATQSARCNWISRHLSSTARAVQTFGDHTKGEYIVRNAKRRSEHSGSLVGRCIAALALAALPTVASADEWTPSKPISQLSYDGTSASKTIYFETPSGSWSAAGCPNARYVMVRGIDGLKEILAVGLVAKTTSANVSFVGSCLNADYFSASYIKME